MVKIRLACLMLLLLVLRATAQDVVKVLAIGNSFSQDAVEQYLHELAEADGYQLIIGNLYIGGCSLERHYNNMVNNTADYAYRKIGLDGVKRETTSMTLEAGLDDEAWDYVSLQQVSGMSGQYATYDPYLTALINHIKEKLPNAKLILHQTWAYAQNSTHSDFAKYDKDQMTMYQAIVDATTKAYNEHQMDLLVPCGTAVQNARTTFIGDNMNRDGYHLNVIHGRYTAACTWYESLFGRSVVGNTSTPTGLSASFKLAAQEAAHAAVQTPYEVTDLSYIENTASSTHYFVTPEGRGTGDGSNWDDAMSLATLTANINNYESGNVFHFAGGVYKPETRLQTTNGYTFIGGYDPALTGKETTTPTYPSPTPTVFSGDRNGNDVADAGDLSMILFLNTQTGDGETIKAIRIQGIDFTCAFDNTDGEHHGALLLRDCGYVKLEDCRFYGNKCTGKLGGMAITSQYSHLEADNCLFYDNVCKARGAALRFSSNDKTKGLGVLNRCAVYHNKVSDGVGTAILVQHGKALYIVNTTVSDNESTSTASGAIYTNGKGDFENKLYIVGSTIAGNKGGSQIEMAANAQLYLANAIVVGDDTNAAYNFKGSITTFATGGYNVCGSDSKLTAWDNTDSAVGNTYASVFGTNVLNDAHLLVPLAESSLFTSEGLGDKVSTWGIPADITIDQLGAQRTDGTLPGAYGRGIIVPTNPTNEDVVNDFEVDLSEVSRNPLQGWVIYAGLGDGLSDNFWSEYDNFTSSEGKIKVSDYATTLFIRAAWTYFNPEENVYAWQSTCNTKPAQRLKMLVEGAKQRNLKLAFSLITDSRDKHDTFTPQYVKDAGAQGFTSTTGSTQVWSPYPDDPVFQAKYEQFLTAFAEQYNDPDLVQFISGTGLGKWGEGHSLKYSTGNMTPRESVFDWITGLTASLFTKVPIVINYHRWILTGTEWDDNKYDANSERLLDKAVNLGFSLRHDAMGMKTYYSNWEKNYVHKYTYQRPVLSEGGWVKASHGGSPMKQDGYADYAAVRHGEFDDAQDAHANMMDFRYNSNISDGETYSWFNEAFDLVKRFIREGGYHLYPTQVTMPSVVKPGSSVTLKSIWANCGWGYCPTNLPQWNQKYKVAYALMQGNTVKKVFVDQESDLSKIVKDNDQTFSSPFDFSDVAVGNYTWAVGLVDTTKDNAIGLDIAVAKDKKRDGWVVLNSVTVTTDETTGVAATKSGTLAPKHIYNLAGQRVTRNYRGLAVMNGQKVVMK